MLGMIFAIHTSPCLNLALFLNQKIKVHVEKCLLFLVGNVHEHSLNLPGCFFSGCVTLLLTCSLPWVVMRTLRPRTSRRSWTVLVSRPMTHVCQRYRAVVVAAVVVIQVAIHCLCGPHNFHLSTGHL